MSRAQDPRDIPSVFAVPAVPVGRLLRSRNPATLGVSLDVWRLLSGVLDAVTIPKTSSADRQRSH